MKTQVKMMGLKVILSISCVKLTHSLNCYFIADFLSDPNLGLDVVEANRQFMMDSEELYDALIDCHWPALEFPASSEYRSEYS